jgi:MOSC domain-containing protein YiiM
LLQIRRRPEEGYRIPSFGQLGENFTVEGMLEDNVYIRLQIVPDRGIKRVASP